MRRCGLRVSKIVAAELRENQVYVSQGEPRIVERRPRMTDLKSKTIGGVLWSVARAGWSSAVTLVLFIVLARVLEPKDFGLFALASILVEVGRVVSSGGLGDAVIRSQELDDRFLSTVFWLNLALSLGFAFLIALAAPIYASLFDNVDNVHIIYALALTLPLGSLGAEWAEAVPVTQMLSLMVIPFVFNFFCGPALTASNYPSEVLKVAMVQLLTTILCTWIAVRFGLVAVAAAYVLRAYVTMPLQQYMLARRLSIRMSDTGSAMTLPLGCALTMAVSVHFSLRSFETQYAGDWTPALLSVALGALVYTVLVMVLAWAKLRDMAMTLLSTLRKRESSR
ncbi:polysaccharide biosynthesis protein [Aurantiacibacter xanthus]|uniref:Polysaccharide biosynthesis protein n=2 Tax=Aurantiacibacter xanthus TaxID=1784712 RepID=A0A3A1P5C8_9SPHN|nr:polysaccharide biosynthesis protein [Aurantiacibacter xanthus]